MKDFWLNYEKYRNLAGIKDAEVCRRGGLSKATLSQAKKKLVIPQLDTAYNISRALNVTLETLIEGEETDYDFIIKRIKYDEDFRDAAYKLARLQEREQNRIYGAIETYFNDTLDDIQRESTVG